MTDYEYDVIARIIDRVCTIGRHRKGGAIVKVSHIRRVGAFAERPL